MSVRKCPFSSFFIFSNYAICESNTDYNRNPRIRLLRDLDRGHPRHCVEPQETMLFPDPTRLRSLHWIHTHRGDDESLMVCGPVGHNAEAMNTPYWWSTLDPVPPRYGAATKTIKRWSVQTTDAIVRDILLCRHVQPQVTAAVVQNKLLCVCGPSLDSHLYVFMLCDFASLRKRLQGASHTKIDGNPFQKQHLLD